MRQMLIAIRDNKANEIVAGHISMHKHAATAVRMYMDLITNEKLHFQKHLEDYDLVQLGYHLQPDGTDKHIIEPAYEVLMKGAAVKAQGEAAADSTLPLAK